MFERMLDKQNKPTDEEFFEYCGKSKVLLHDADDFLINELKTEKIMRFPYGNSYGWGYKYYIKKKFICDIFAEKDSFNVMLRLANAQFESVYFDVTEDMREAIDRKYPCNDGGWIHYRVTSEEHLDNIKKLLTVKVH